MEGRIMHLAAILEDAVIVEAEAGGKVVPGSVVTLSMDGDEERYLLGSIEERHDDLEVMSPGSPLGDAARRPGGRLRVHLHHPDGLRDARRDPGRRVVGGWCRDRALPPGRPPAGWSSSTGADRPGCGSTRASGPPTTGPRCCCCTGGRSPPTPPSPRPTPRSPTATGSSPPICGATGGACRCGAGSSWPTSPTTPSPSSTRWRSSGRWSSATRWAARWPQLVWHRHADRVDGLVLCSTARHFRGGPSTDVWFRGQDVVAPAVRAWPGLARSRMQRAVEAKITTGPHADWYRSELLRSDPASVLRVGAALGRFRSTDWLGSIDVAHRRRRHHRRRGRPHRACSERWPPRSPGRPSSRSTDRTTRPSAAPIGGCPPCGGPSTTCTCGRRARAASPRG